MISKVSKKSLAVVAAVAATGIAGIASMGAVSAATADTASTGQTGLAQKIAQKFNLNQEEVKAMFDEERQAHETERQQERSERLQSLVDDGKITAEQKTKIEAKQKELQDKREADRDALDTWAEENDIDAQYLMGSGPRDRGGHGGPRGM